MDTISLVSVWKNIILQLSYIFTDPAAGIWQQIMLGWILKRGPTTITGIFRTLGNLADKHWAHNWFVGAITIRLPQWPMIRRVLPTVFALYRKRSDRKSEDIFRTRQELAGEMI
ncbi:MAG: hypothetical protein ABIG61_15645 [Planctomycetota bacterium]